MLCGNSAPQFPWQPKSSFWNLSPTPRGAAQSFHVLPSVPLSLFSCPRFCWTPVRQPSTAVTLDSIAYPLFSRALSCLMGWTLVSESCLAMPSEHSWSPAHSLRTPDSPACLMASRLLALYPTSDATPSKCVLNSGRAPQDGMGRDWKTRWHVLFNQTGWSSTRKGRLFHGR